jgi:predicted nucleic acid-binding protein
MSGDFLDSNVLIYALDPADSAKRRIADVIVSGGITSGQATISFQVVQEVLNVVTSRLSAIVSDDDRLEYFHTVLMPLWKVSPSPGMYRSALALRSDYGFSFYDSLIVAAALESGCDRLLTEDLQHGQQIEGLTIHNPFR